MAGIEEFENQNDEAWKLDVQDNMTHLTQSIGDLTGILTHLIEHQIISNNEREIILNEQHHPTAMDKNFKLLTTLKSKGWSKIKPAFIQILKDTLNQPSAHIIEFHTFQPLTCANIPQQTQTKILPSGTINSKWWPDQLRLPTSFLERKTENKLLIENLKKVLTENKSKMTVINQQVTLSGLGGIGKTTTAKSFANKYAADYDLILWIDCGEGSLIISFKKLARDLELKNRQELELRELACRSFEILKESKCLFIFDNAQCYIGKEGIRDVLPKNHDNFHVIITSRNREWGQANIDGQISEFQLGAFGEDEGLEFMNKNIKNVKKNDERKIKILCNLLSYLPLALQIAVSTLNKHKISLDKYIEKMKTTDDILDAPLDEYERTIRKTLKVTLELIQNHERKNVAEIANKILSIFGYISPDAVDSDFFVAVQIERKGFFAKAARKFQFRAKQEERNRKKEADLTRMEEEIDEATELLQFYSILSKTKISEGRFKLNIHRLFQQVLRHNTNKIKNEILRQIFNCQGYLEYKLIPFIYYADESLQKEFPKLKSELIDKVQLEKLLKEKRFQEAVELSRLIKYSNQTPVSIFNFALCLKYNHENQEAKKILKELLKNTERHENFNKLNNVYDFSLIMHVTKKVTHESIACELFLIYSEEKDEEAARQIFPSAMINKVNLNHLVHQRRFQEAVELSRLVKDSIQTPVSIFNFALCLKHNHEREERKKILQELLGNTNRLGNINKIYVEYYKFSSVMNYSGVLTFGQIAWELFLLYCEEKDEEAARQIFLSATQMTLLKCPFNSSVLSLLPHCLQILELHSCTISNGSSPTFGGIQLPPQMKGLNLWWNKFVDDDGKELKPLDISQLIPLNLNQLEIFGSICVSLDRLKLIPSVHLEFCSLILIPGLHITPQELTLMDVEFFASDKEPIGNVLVNDFVDFRQMKELSLIGSGMSIDLCDPLTLNYLYLGRTKVLDWEKANWTVHKLKLFKVDFVDRTGMKVTEMEIYYSSVDISALPSTIRKLKLSGCNLVNFSFSPVAYNKLLLNLNQLYLADIALNNKKNSSNNELLRFLVQNVDNYKIKKSFIGGSYLVAHKNQET